jgi:hypothetical protein
MYRGQYWPLYVALLKLGVRIHKQCKTKPLSLRETALHMGLHTDVRGSDVASLRRKQYKLGLTKLYDFKSPDFVSHAICS